MSQIVDRRVLCFVCVVALAATCFAQEYGKPDRVSPGDEMIQGYLREQALKVEALYADDLKSRKDWEAKRPQYVEEYYYMLGLSPRPEWPQT